MIGFAVFAALLAAFALRLLLAPLSRSAPPPAAQRVAADERTGNLRVLREQLVQIDAELAAGTIDAAQHRRARAELERRVLEEEGPGERFAAEEPTPGHARRTAWALGVALPAFGLLGYLWLGAPHALRLSPQPAPVAAEHGPSAQEVDAMVERLAERLKANPGDGEGWAMLARSYAALERFPQAAEAYAKAVALQPADATLLADFADALAMAQGQKLAGEPTRLIERALAIDARNLKALALAASAAMERQDYAAAIGYWQAALQQVAPGSEQAQAIERSLAAAQDGARASAAAGRAAAPVAPASPASGRAALPAAAPAAAAGRAASGSAAAQRAEPASLRGTVRLAPALAAQVRPGDTVFVFARAAEGPRVPLAILRRSAADLPLSFTLDDSQAMSPQARLSQFDRVQVVARISRSGEATARSGDLQGQVGPVPLGSTGLEVVIDGALP